MNDSERWVHQSTSAAQNMQVQPAKPAYQKRGLAFQHLLLAFLLSLGLSYFVILGGWSLGFFLVVLAVQMVFLAWLYLPFPSGSDQAKPVQPLQPVQPADLPGRKQPLPLLIILAAAIIDLSFCYVLYDNILLKVLNFPVIVILCAVQYLMAARVFLHDWDKPGFWEEAILSGVARPFTGLPGFGRALTRLFSRSPAPGSPRSADSANPVSPRRPAVGKVLIGILLAIPILLLSGSVLAAADPVFKDILEKLFRPLADLSLGDLFENIFVSAILLPFIFSFLYSGRSGKRLSAASLRGVQQPDATTRTIRIDKTILVSFLTCVNLLYLAFAFIQLAYLTGAFQAVLPAGMTYAEYARSGFFELSGISVINLILVLLAVKAADRRDAAGLVLRIESVLLISGSLVQWASAMFRMKMYMDAYGLTLLRFLVTAFMLLLMVLFALLTVKEFRRDFPLFKSCAAATLASLLILNHANCDAWTARHNVRRYQATQQIDLDYLDELSSSAVPAMLEITGAGDKVVASEIAGRLLNRYFTQLDNYSADRWQNLNISQAHAQQVIHENLDELKRLNPDAYAQMQNQ